MKKKKTPLKLKLQQIVDLLKFILTTDDEEITRSCLESIIETLEEELK